MATLNWINVEVMPLAIGGAGLVYVQMDPLTPYATVLMFVGPRLPTSHADAGTDLVMITLDPPDNPTLGARSAFWSAPATVGQCIQFYAFTPGGAWETGPSFTGVDLTPNYSTAFPWSADWVVQRLKEIALHVPPFPNGKILTITRAFPRDTHSWPAVNVQVDALTPSGPIIGDVMNSAPQTASNTIVYTKGRLYSLNLSITGWCGTPEERSLLGQWMGGALEVVMDAAVAVGWPDPSANLRESEEFETLQVPTFLVNGGISVTLQSSLKATLRSSYRATMIAAPEATPSNFLTFTI